MRRRVWRGWAIAVVAGLGSAGPLGAVGGTATDQAVSLTYTATHWGNQPAAHLTGVDAGGDVVWRSGWWYRLGSDSQEFALPAPDTETYADGRITATWNNLDFTDLRVVESTDVFDQEGPSGGFVSTLVVSNTGPNSLAGVTFFHYLDPDVGGTFASDQGTLLAGGPTEAVIKLVDGASSMTYRARHLGGFAVSYQVANASVGGSLLSQLNDTSLTTLANAGLPFGPGDAEAANQFGPQTLGPGGSTSYGVSAVFNAPRDHVKGDFDGFGWPAFLFGQSSATADRKLVRLRRTTQLPS